jgi:hypothetical protein
MEGSIMAEMEASWKSSQTPYDAIVSRDISKNSWLAVVSVEISE